jgi:hypothetical protein
MTGIICALVGGSAAPVLDTQTVTVDSFSDGSNPVSYWSGYGSPFALGAIVDGTSNIYGGAAIFDLYFYQESTVSPPVGYTTRYLLLTIDGSQADSGWTTMTVGTTVFTRASATYSAGSTTSWLWNIPIPDPFVDEGDPFSTGNVAVWR